MIFLFLNQTNEALSSDEVFFSSSLNSILGNFIIYVLRFVLKLRGFIEPMENCPIFE